MAAEILTIENLKNMLIRTFCFTLMLTVFSALAQNTCKSELDEAWKEYQSWNFEKAIVLTVNCLNKTGATKEEKERAYEIQAHAYLRFKQDAIELTENALTRLMEINYTYNPGLKDLSPNFVKFVYEFQASSYYLSKNDLKMAQAAMRKLLNVDPAYGNKPSTFKPKYLELLLTIRYERKALSYLRKGDQQNARKKIIELLEFDRHYYAKPIDQFEQKYFGLEYVDLVDLLVQVVTYERKALAYDKNDDQKNAKATIKKLLKIDPNYEPAPNRPKRFIKLVADMKAEMKITDNR